MFPLGINYDNRFASPSRRCLHFEVVGGLEWSNDPESYAGGSVATGRASLAGTFKGDDSDLRETPRSSGAGGWACGWRPHPGKTYVDEKAEMILCWKVKIIIITTNKLVEFNYIHFSVDKSYI